jgi:hypothetical protein
LLLLKSIIDRGPPGLIVLALEHRRQCALEVVNQFVHRRVERASAAGRKFDRDWPIGLCEVVDINPIGRARAGLRLFSQHGFDGLLHACPVGADHKKVESVFVDLRAESNCFKCPRLAEHAIDRWELGRRQEGQS